MSTQGRTLSLTELANLHKTDKGTTARIPHGYTTIYDVLFAPMRNEGTKLLELGLAPGGPEHGVSSEREIMVAPSVNMWLDYFPRALLYAFDICKYESRIPERLTFIRGDAGDPADLLRLKDQISGDLDVIIDDASHASYHQTLCLKELFQKLRPGGLYIIEDLHWQPPIYEETLPGCHKIRDQIAHFQREGAFLSPLGGDARCDLSGIERSINNIIAFEQIDLAKAVESYNIRFGLTANIPDGWWLHRRLLDRLRHKRYIQYIALRARKYFTPRGLDDADFIKLAILQKAW